MMKKILLIILLSSVFNAVYSQKRKETRLYTTGPVAPVNPTYADYTSYNSEFKHTESMAEYCKNNRIAFSQSDIAKNIVALGGLKNKDNGDYKVVFDVTKFKFIEYTSVSKIPAIVLGMEANFKVYDKDKNVIFERYLPATTNSYLYSSKSNMTDNFYNILNYQYEKLSKDFMYYFMYGPLLRTKVINLDKTEGNTAFADFGSSVEVFSALEDIKKSEHAETLNGTIAYWKGFLGYKKDKNNDVNMDVKLAAYYNTAMALILQNKVVEAQKLLSPIKANDRKFFGTAGNFNNMERVINQVKEYQANIKDFKNINPIQEAPVALTSKYADNVFEFMAMDNAEITTKKDKVIKGIVKVYYDNPVVVDLQSATTTEDGPETALGMAGALFKMLKTENCSVRVEVAGQKKPTKMKLDDVLSIKAENGKTYDIAEVGFLESKRYAVMETIKGNAKVSYLEEIFPGNESVLKRANKEDYFQIAEINGKKSLKGFFNDCPKLYPKIDAGEYTNVEKNAYLRLIDDYLSLCGGVKK